MSYLSYEWLGRHGAMGNQLWQIAGTIGEAKKRGMEPLFPKWPYEKWFSFPKKMFVDSLKDYDREDMGTVYLQDLDHWWDIREHIFTYMLMSDFAEEQLEKQYPVNSLNKFTAVHVRRANNLALPNHHPVPTLDYFEQALDVLKPLQVMVFSDDLDWCKKQSIFEGALFAKGNPNNINVMELTGANPLPLSSVALDFTAMRACSSFIISNSTFSCWAALLANHFNAIKPRVVYPNNWYGPAIRDSVDHTLMFKHHPTWIGI